MHEADESAMTGIVHDNSLLNSQDEAVDLAALTRALDAGQVDVAVHWLQLLLLSRTGDQPIQHGKTLKSSRVRRLKTLQNAVAQMLDDYEKHTEEEGLTLHPGLAPSSTAYNVVRALLLRDLSLDLAALESTCDALMVKHEALRTCFDVDTNAGGQPRQIVHPLAHFRAHEVARLAVREGHKLLPLILLDGLPFEIPGSKHVTKEEKAATRLRIEQYAREAFGDALLRPFGENYRKFCAMEEEYQPYAAAEMDAYLESVAISVDNPAILLERNEDNLLRVVAAANAASGIVVPAWFSEPIRRITVTSFLNDIMGQL
ncbi:hypothetical protein JG688_00015977 [Phytophthora aleatoria]|uniref:Uncharacterized protein n=1 Tax=Phytophthora aleatoria TaxID=2496075 RepID=A0A8J5I4S8_9STRA|nr:hypothetical protein JG688_00015977 [Phytophthora aleatoria]